jgi:O-antigen/teichoic acid export membrane protein
VSAGFIITAAYFMDFIIKIAFGVAFLPAASLVNIQLCAVALFLSGNTLNPALMSMGADKALLFVSLIATVAFYASIVPLLHMLGAEGAVICQVIFNFILLGGSWALFLRLSASPSMEISV